MAIPAAAAATAAATTAASAVSGAAAAGTSAMSNLSGNFTDFLKLLMTQLKNQDPTAPLDTNQFTSQLVQFTSVEQQINTNSSLTKLIQATQGNTLLQSGGLIGQRLEVTGGQISLQGGSGTLNMQVKVPGQATIGIYSPAGDTLRLATVDTRAGTNTWKWDGKGDNGRTLPDGAYKIAVLDGSNRPIDFTTVATATGVSRANGAVTVALGKMDVDFSNVQAVGLK